MDLPVLFANLNDLIQVIIFLVIMGVGTFVRWAAEKKKQEAAQKNQLPLEEKLMQTDSDIVQKPQKNSQSRKNKRKTLVDAAMVDTSRSQMKPLRSQESAISSIPVMLPNSEQISSGLAVEIHQLLHDPQSIRQAMILSEVLTRRHF